MNNNIITEFNNILKHEEIIREDKYKYLSNDIINYINNHNDILLIINAEYDAPKEDCIINYYNMYWGNNQFNELLKKYNARYEWYDTTTLFIYKNNHDDDDDDV